jgi:hypothetical protein
MARKGQVLTATGLPPIPEVRASEWPTRGLLMWRLDVATEFLPPVRFWLFFVGTHS